jgi:glucose/mannose-6-phosphate isomerase
MLDDLKVIHERDAQDALGVAEKQWQQYSHNFEFSWQPPQEIFNVVIAGMGGSALAGKVFASWPGLDVPITIVQDYDLPSHVSANTLVICSSYSGNTEETVSVLKAATHQTLDAEQRPMVVVIASGGELAKQASELNLPLITIPDGFQPRCTLGYQLRAIIEVFEQTPLLAESLGQLETAATWLKDEITRFIPTVPTERNPAKQLALDIVGKSVVIYSGPKLAPAAYKWKIDCNENAKNIAWWGTLPEFNHNEIMGWTSQPVDKPYAVIELRSALENPRVQKRQAITEQVLSGKRPAVHAIEVQGDTLLAQLLWSIMLGDFVSLYLAMLNKVNPTPVDLLEKFKQAMRED